MYEVSLVSNGFNPTLVLLYLFVSIWVGEISIKALLVNNWLRFSETKIESDLNDERDYETPGAMDNASFV